MTARYPTLQLPLTLFLHFTYLTAIQWFGVDIGGTLVKCVYYETQREDVPPDPEHKGIRALKDFINSNLKYGSTGIRDKRLEMTAQHIGSTRVTGTLHFIKFATHRMEGFMDMVTKNGFSEVPKIVCATGGGAFKFEKEFKEVENKKNYCQQEFKHV